MYTFKNIYMYLYRYFYIFSLPLSLSLSLSLHLCVCVCYFCVSFIIQFSFSTFLDTDSLYKSRHGISIDPLTFFHKNKVVTVIE